MNLVAVEFDWNSVSYGASLKPIEFNRFIGEYILNFVLNYQSN